ncbi:hypothetical protein TIFTF001_010379 [Ficus carica]|uniref:Cytochrome P450 n=1 Tax=Ficus carica TaxID=3494 RepID=A0AA87ZWX1_FICCA|nr:hypothetical protein TIFTF001_010379 [Ficus carica]
MEIFSDPSTVLLATLIALVFAYFNYKFKRSSPFRGKNLPPGSYGLPLIGESISFVRAQTQNKTVQWIQDRVNKHGPVFKTSILGSKVAIVTGQAGNRFVFNGGDGALSLNQPKSVTKILGKYSLFEITGPRHKLIRAAIAAFVTPESIQRYLGDMESVIQKKLFKELEGKDMVYAVPLMKTIAFNVICTVFFGLPDDDDERDELLKDFSTTVKGAWAVPLDFPGTVFHRALRARKRLDGNGEPLLEDEILDLSLSLIMASHDTVTVVLSLFIRQLAKDPEVFQKVLEEHKEVEKAKRGREGEKLSWHEIQMMKYTWKVAQELMRIDPPVFGNFRLAERDINFDGYDIPKGWQVFWATSGTHMDNNIFEDAFKFDPSRFENPTRSYPPYTYIPFGAGPRVCPGADFTRVEILLVIHHMVTEFQWTQMVPNEPITRQPVPLPAKGLPIILQPANH